MYRLCSFLEKSRPLNKKKAWDFVDSTLQNYSAILPLQLQKVHTKEKDVYRLEEKLGELIIHTACPHAAMLALEDVMVAAKSQFSAEAVGSKEASHPFRCLFLQGEVEVSLTDGFSLAIPSSWLENEELERKINEVCQRLLSLGYNVLAIGSFELKEEKDDSFDLNLLLEICHDYGIRVAVLPRWKEVSVFCPVHADYSSALQKAMDSFHKAHSSVDFFGWQSGSRDSRFFEDSAAEDTSFTELLHCEMHAVSKAVGNELGNEQGVLYFLPYSENKKKELFSLALEAPSNTALLFSSVAGSCFDDHAPLHPFWEQLREFSETVHTPLIPCLNAGLVGFGGGLWPLTPLDLFSKVFPRMKRHLFAGTFVSTQRIPASYGFLHQSLWIAGQSLWGEKDPLLLRDRWMRAFQKEWADEKIFSLLSDCRYHALSLRRMQGMDSSERETKWADVIFAEAKRLKEESAPSSLEEYIRFFLRDQKRLLLQRLQKSLIPTTPYMGGEETEEGFWTSTKEKREGRFSTQLTIQKRKIPLTAGKDPVLAKIAATEGW